jgi:hypothetical protein
MATKLGLTLENFSLEKKILQNRLNSIISILQNMKNTVIGFEDVGLNLKSNRHKTLSFELENKSLCN